MGDVVRDHLKDSRLRTDGGSLQYKNGPGVSEMKCLAEVQSIG